MADKEKAIKKLKEVLDSLDITNKYRLNLIEAIECLQEEPISEELEEYSAFVADELPQGITLTSNGEFDIASVRKLIIDACKYGAKWQKEQFEKNRLTACDNMTKEEFEREQEFTTDFIEKNNRIPTYSDAIEYGRKQMIDKACKFIAENMTCDGYTLQTKAKFIRDFKKYMEL